MQQQEKERAVHQCLWFHVMVLLLMLLSLHKASQSKANSAAPRPSPSNNAQGPKILLVARTCLAFEQSDSQTNVFHRLSDVGPVDKTTKKAKSHR
jgi:hypothetical protein